MYEMKGEMAAENGQPQSLWRKRMANEIMKANQYLAWHGQQRES
jgi:hypothetical protein